jgi:hypothetical protein
MLKLFSHKLKEMDQTADVLWKEESFRIPSVISVVL